MAQIKRVKTKKRTVSVDKVGQAHIKASYNNIIISITNLKGDVISWSSAGKMAFKGPRKRTPYAAQSTATDCAAAAHRLGLRTIDVFVKGPGNGREAAIRALQGAGLEIKCIKDITPIPHNGCRPPKLRRS